MRALSWNLFHGRAVPDRPRSLLPEFSAAIAGWDWDVALLQEVPPWWPEALAAAAGADHRLVRTSRNALLPLRRALAQRRPDLMKSNGGGADAILVRGAAIAEHRTWRLRLHPERRFVHAVRLADGHWIGNVHAQANPKPLAHADMAVAGATLVRWAGHAPVLLGGDCNVPDPVVAGFTDAGGHGIDRFFVRGGLNPEGPVRRLPREGLSDHAPVLVTLRSS
ncbi:endonuclease/exonuclease/phosphatase family protein [Baekduia soli]|uniref:Endonuclease/exonuclease/phosphatase family protein n=1 Tax=Baekduia soli TaxID=496014 RepID=A0A5B8U1W8_9ACTN|nr:endonuclease/exonuclease/phosphatase family protein [Baekduia soli]QEC46958.1 endonuclease/exonuclease/phosphatase family protein [Baekduia soli]